MHNTSVFLPVLPVLPSWHLEIYCWRMFFFDYSVGSQADSYGPEADIPMWVVSNNMWPQDWSQIPCDETTHQWSTTAVSQMWQSFPWPVHIQGRLNCSAFFIGGVCNGKARFVVSRVWCIVVIFMQLCWIAAASFDSFLHFWKKRRVRAETSWFDYFMGKLTANGWIGILKHLCEPLWRFRRSVWLKL